MEHLPLQQIVMLILQVGLVASHFVDPVVDLHAAAQVRDLRALLLQRGLEFLMPLGGQRLGHLVHLVAALLVQPRGGLARFLE